MVSAKTRRAVYTFLVLVLMLTCPAYGCGPGPNRGRRKKFSKMTPLVYKQHVPNVSENTLGASGQAEKPITRDDPRFKDLVENNNPDIVVRDEEGDGSDRIMSKRCKDKLNVLAVLVQNEWPGTPPEIPPVKLKVKEAWDDNTLPGQHGENSLHYEGRAVDVSTSDRDRSKLGMLARLAVEAGFDWVYYEAHGHIHCSVKSDSSAAIKVGGCFPGNGEVLSKTEGYKPISDLHVGEEVLSMSSSGTMEFSEILAFLDVDTNAYGLFYTFTTESGDKTTLTAKHLIYASDTNATIHSTDSLKVLYAENVKPGQFLLLGRRDSLTFSKVSNITVDTKRGIYAPLTKHGTIVVDGIVASCYAYINSINIAHFVFAPMRAFHDISEYLRLFGWTSYFTESNNTPTNGMHWYARLLYGIGTNVLSQETLYVH